VASSEAYSTDALAAILFMQSSQNTLDVYSTLNSSPWTAESFGADERRTKALKEYVTHAVVYSMAYAIMAGILAKKKYAWGIVGAAAVTNVYLIWLYARASRRGREAGSGNWANGS
jgi:hypothetical protein